MDNLPEKAKPAPPIQITEDIQVSLNRLGRDLETHAESGIRIGKELIYLKEITPHGTFGDLVEWAYGLKEHSRTNYMNVALKFGENCTRVQFSNRVLIELSRPSVPDSARKEAKKHEDITVKQAKEIAKANKRIEELKFECQRLAASTNPPPDLENLIPEIDKLFRSGSIVLARAKQLSVLSHDNQEIYLSEFHSKEFHRKSADREKAKAEEAMAKALKAIEEKELALTKLEEATGTTESDLIFKHDKELTELRTGYLEMLREEKTKAQKEASELHARLNKEHLGRAHKEKFDAIKAKTQAQEKASAAYKAQGELESKIKKLEEQLEVNNPTNVDLAMEKQIQSVTNSVMFVMKQLRNDMLTIGGGMERSIRAAESLMEEIANKLAEIEGDSEEIIEIGA